MRFSVNLLIGVLLLRCVASAFGDDEQVTSISNRWVRLEKAGIGPRIDPALVYDSAAKRFLLLGGGIAWPTYGKKPHPFDDLALDVSAGQWENLYPSGKNWGPKFGNTSPPLFKNETFGLTDREGNVRPNLSTYRGVYYYNQYAYDSVTKRVYFHARGHTFCYDPATRVWRDLKPATNPTGGRDKPSLLWSAMCCDPVNKQILLFGGGNVMSERGGPGTWTYDPASNVWSRLEFRSEALDGPRKQAEETRARAKALAQAVRARYYHAELAEQKKVDLAANARQLAADIAALRDALQKAKHKADEHEKQQIAWSIVDLDDANENLKTASRLLAKNVNSEGIRSCEVAKLALVSVRDSLGLQPPQRALSRMVYDPVNRQIVLFGGDQLDRLLADTWVFDCDSRKWREKRPALSPSPRAGHALVYLPKSKKVLLFGGYTYTSGTEYCSPQFAALPFEMWTYDLGTNEWKLLQANANEKAVPYKSAFYMSFTTHPAAADSRDLVVAIGQGGGTQAAEAETWQCQVDASLQQKEATAKHGVEPGTFTERKGPFVPTFFDEAPSPDPTAASTRLKNLPANTWVSIVPPHRPNMDRCWGTAVYSPDHDVIMHWSGGHSSHCGTEVICYHPSINRWSLATASEQPLEFVYTNDQTPGQWSFKRRPWMTGHTYRSYGYDPVLKRMLYSGKGQWTYIFDPAAGEWEKRTVANRFDGGMFTVTLCSTPRGAVAWSNQLIDRVTTGLWQMDAASFTWKPLPLKGKLPSIRPDRHGLAYDSKRDRLLCIAPGSGEITSYDLKTGIAKPLSPTGREKAGLPAREAIYLPETDMVLVQAQVEGKRWLAYDCATNAWVGVKFAGPDLIGKRVFNNSVGLTYDSNRGLVWALGQRSEIWVLRIESKSADVQPLDQTDKSR